MPSLTITHSPSNTTLTETFDAAAQTRFLNWWRATRPQNPDNRTDPQVLAEWAKWVMNETWKAADKREADLAGTAASAGVAKTVRT